MPPAPRRPLRAFLRTLWMPILWAIPFGLFFGFLFGGSRRDLIGAYLVSLVFSYCIGFTLWVAEHLLAPRLRLEDPLAPGRIVRHAALFTGASILGAYAGAVIVHLTLLPGFMGSSRQIVMVTLFTLVFAVLVSGLIYAWHFYRSALDKVRAEQELDLARRIQRGFLLTRFPSRPRIEVHAVNLSSREVSGDFYDVVPAGDAEFLLAVADVSGKGVPAALLSSMLQASVRTQAGLARSTAGILANVNTLVCGSTSRQQFATFFLAHLDERTLALTYTNAGHNPPLLLRNGQAPRPLERGGTIVGMLDDLALDEETVTLAAGDRVVAYTDGLSEARRPDGTMFGDDRVAQVAAALDPGLGAEAMCAALLARLNEWLDGRDAGDDVTVMVLRVLPEPADASAAT
jgi:serine phosphatase RsbU (regulator of sigma subunit)